MSLLNGFFLFVAALLGGTLNAVAGGGTFLTVPTLLFVGVLPVNANATSTLALWPASLASAGAYRSELAEQRPILVQLGVISLIGGIIGAILLLHTPQQLFLHMLPFLLLVATLLFAYGPQVSARLRKPTAEPKSTSQFVTITIQLIIAIYGGFFGGGIGILMLSLLALSGMTNVHSMNAVKTVLAFLINGMAVILFIAARIINWPLALIMLAGSLFGGYYGAFFARKIAPAIIRRIVIGVGSAVTAILFVQAFVL
jgi:uncharacterized membrane protein YfcA